MLRGGSAAVAAFHLVHRVAAAALSRATILRNLETKVQPKPIECSRRDVRIIRGVRTPEGCLDVSSGAALSATTASTAPTATPARNTATNLLSERLSVLLRTQHRGSFSAWLLRTSEENTGTAATVTVVVTV